MKLVLAERAPHGGISSRIVTKNEAKISGGRGIYDVFNPLCGSRDIAVDFREFPETDSRWSFVSS
jgi:hypothetical protein